MDKINVSACIVTFNDESRVLKSLKSLKENTTDVNLKIYVSDNASTDNTVKKITEEFPQVIIIKNNTNEGFGSGHNKVLPFLDSKYHAIINPDIEMDQDVLSKLIFYLEKNSDVGLVTPKVLFMDGTEQHLPKRKPTFRYLLGGRIGLLSKFRREYTMADVTIVEPIDVEFCSGCFMVIKTELFKQIGGFDERYFMYFEDADLTRSVREFKRAIFYPGTYIYHAWERAGARKAKYFFIQVQSMFRYFWKWNVK